MMEIAMDESAPSGPSYYRKSRPRSSLSKYGRTVRTYLPTETLQTPTICSARYCYCYCYCYIKPTYTTYYVHIATCPCQIRSHPLPILNQHPHPHSHSHSHSRPHEDISGILDHSRLSAPWLAFVAFVAFVAFMVIVAFVAFVPSRPQPDADVRRHSSLEGQRC
ncbi:hypothetical protein GGR50DRAFT_182332 [Xylaria sp. CBS 124048]|nr:hypothetical protein GGR50DRAFT_182332 [Xylaria sp. CBS 124048]